MIYKSDMLFTPLKGRPYGGRAFIVNKSLIIDKVDFLNKHISYLTLKFNSNSITFISVYLPFDNNSYFNLSKFLACLQVWHELFLFYLVRRHLVFILGDFNADITRNNRFDLIFHDFLSNNNLCISSPSININGNINGNLFIILW